MPILDPILQYQLVIRTQKSDPKQKNQFFQYFLDTASQNIYKSSESIKAYIQFKKDFQHYFDKLKQYFNLKDQNEINLKEIPDLYRYLNERISENGQEKTINGDYFTIKSNNYDFNYFQPHVNFSDQHSWFLCNSPIAILSLRIEDICEKHLGLILLETDLMQAAGYMLILCVSITNNYFDVSDSFLGDLILNHNFAEVHINLIQKMLIFINLLQVFIV